MWERFDIWLFLAGLGIFLFGIRLIEDSIARLGGRGFRKLVQRGTRTSFRAVVTGVSTTAILQSSSAVALMVLAFVGAGVMGLGGGIGVILGSNIGTTATSWIVATIGFKLDIEDLALPLIGIGGLVLIFLGRSPRYAQTSHLLVGFGFLFLGLDHMKDSVAELATEIDPSLLVNAKPWVFLLLGLGLTAVMQSSSATVAVLLTALHAGVFDLREGAYAIIGTNMGTTITVFLGALGGSVVKKRLAWSHLGFNAFAGVIAVVAMPLYLMVVKAVLGADEDPVLGLALFHTLFNVVGVLVMFPYIHAFGRLVERLVPERIPPRTRYIAHTSADIPEAAVAGVEKEVDRLLAASLIFQLELFDAVADVPVPATLLEHSPTGEGFEMRYDDLKQLQAEILVFVTRIEGQELHEQESALLNRLVHAARLALYAAKGAKDVKRNIDAFSEAGGRQEQYQLTLRRRMITTHDLLARILAGEAQDPTTTLATVLRQIQQDDDAAMLELNKSAREGVLRNKEFSTALLMNRAVVRSTHDLALAIAELKLDASELLALHRVQEVEEALEAGGVV
jgi:phosphate:Na+ symporter